jgi:excisionase family DNA binding protein
MVVQGSEWIKSVEPLYTPKEVGEYFGVQSATVRNWIRDGMLIAITLPSGRLRVRHSEMVKYANERYGDKDSKETV